MPVALAERTLRSALSHRKDQAQRFSAGYGYRSAQAAMAGNAAWDSAPVGARLQKSLRQTRGQWRMGLARFGAGLPSLTIC